MTPGPYLTVGEVAKRSGVAVSAIHFYERKGLIRGWRSSGNQRRYPREILRYLAIIKAALNGSTMTLLTDGVDVMLPVGVTAGMLAAVKADKHPIADMDGFAGLLAFLEVLKRKDVSWAVLDTKWDKSE